MNKRKTFGLLLSCSGIVCSRIDVFMTVDKAQLLFFIKLLGTLLALSGIFLFATGIKVFEKVMKTCPECSALNDASREICNRCRKPLTKGEDKTERKSFITQ